MKTEKPKTFIQVFIKTEADLPKEGNYFVNLQGYITSYVYSNLIPDNKEKWLHEVDWYLQPLPDKIEVPMTDDRVMELLNKYSTTSAKWISQVYKADTKLIDPMDYHKIAEEFINPSLVDVGKRKVSRCSNCGETLYDCDSSCFYTDKSEQPESGKSAEEILIERKLLFTDGNGNVQPYFYSNMKSVEIIEAMEEFANQFKK